ncbi:WSC domain-containing protein [Morchella snyderi]|nr:WSC domain-containing protein [Morchella snyderi]
MHVSHLLLPLLALPAALVLAARPTSTHGWLSRGCWIDAPNRLLSAVILSDSGMTIERCLARCNSYRFGLVENADQCFCGDILSGGREVALSECNMPCKGDSTQMCGGTWRSNLYEKGPGAWCVGAAADGVGALGLGGSGLVAQGEL